MSHFLDQLVNALKPRRDLILKHPLYARLSDLPSLRLFMEHHVFAVWDFMSLLKALQRSLSCVDVPWIPRGPTASRRLILEIVLGEECDAIEGEYLSHFELYRRAMRECGANEQAIAFLLENLQAGATLTKSLEKAPSSAREFVGATWSLLGSEKPHVLAGAFTFGREDLIPGMFRHILADLDRRHGGSLGSLQKYLERHVQLDEEQHHPMALAMVQELCGEDATRWAETQTAAEQTLAARLRFWDGIYERLQQ